MVLSETCSKILVGKLFGDKGYISKKLAELLAVDDVELITKLKKNMKPKVDASASNGVSLRSTPSPPS
jgi:hypothetical protein